MKIWSKRNLPTLLATAITLPVPIYILSLLVPIIFKHLGDVGLFALAGLITLAITLTFITPPPR